MNEKRIVLNQTDKPDKPLNGGFPRLIYLIYLRMINPYYIYARKWSLLLFFFVNV
ncbi:hypothetical protein RhiirC2_752607, partial [Rhizophagus irregularis]